MTYSNTRAWTAAEDATLQALWGQTTQQAIADALKRSVDSVSARAARLGLKGEPSANVGYSDRLAELATSDATRQFAAHFTKIARRRGWHVHEFRGAGA